ncbi:MAG: class I SAM-dependent methyltransferase [Planctomycetota bacterium]|nr:MAG: class I SAM-dependent methyltransferase [Planctomycetota bacterium]
MSQPDRSTARRLAADSLARGDAVGWFDELYRHAGDNPRAVPWADLEVNPNLAAWLETQPLSALGKHALVVGCGLGDDAEELAACGLQVTAFDVSDTAIAWCRKRFPHSSVDYVTADLLALPPAWRGAFSFVFEAYTLQVLPPELRAGAVAAVAECLAPGGTLLVVARGRDPEDDPGSMPWPLLRTDLQGFRTAGLDRVSFEDYHDAEDPPVRRFRAVYRRGP